MTSSLLFLFAPPFVGIGSQLERTRNGAAEVSRRPNF